MSVPIIADDRIWPISLEQIEATVADYLGPGRVKSNSPAPVFSRHVSMYLARHVAGWSYPKITRFYNRRHYTTVMAAVRKIERLRASDESVDALIDMLTATLSPDSNPGQASTVKSKWHRLIVDALSERVIRELERSHGEAIPSRRGLPSAKPACFPGE